MKLRVLVDNHTYIDQYYYGEPGACYYIEDGDVRLLLDTGHSALFLQNAAAMGIDLRRLDAIALSHGHSDHTGGLAHYFASGEKKPVRVIAHPAAFDEKRTQGVDYSCPIDRHTLAQRCALTLTKQPLPLSERITFLGEIPRLNDFEQPEATRTSDGAFDPLYDDTALCYRSERGLYIITGCSHSGICNIVERAKAVCKEQRIAGILGGMHLFKLGERVDKTIDYLSQCDVQMLYPCHCTSFKVRAAMAARLPVREVGVNMQLEW